MELAVLKSVPTQWDLLSVHVIQAILWLMPAFNVLVSSQNDRYTQGRIQDDIEEGARHYRA